VFREDIHVATTFTAGGANFDPVDGSDMFPDTTEDSNPHEVPVQQTALFTVDRRAAVRAQT
jgi:hypothetical protein